MAHCGGVVARRVGTRAEQVGEVIGRAVPAKCRAVGVLPAEIVAPCRHRPHLGGVFPFGVALKVAVKDARRLAVLLLVVALDGGKIERVFGELRLLAEGDAEKELDGLATGLGVGRLHENRRTVEIGVGRILALRIKTDGTRERLGVVRGGTEVVERCCADISRNAVGVKHL